ncbi:MAG: cobalamin-dependent protein [Thiohalomonadaceae bacterium]
MRTIIDALLEGDSAASLAAAKQLQQTGISAEQIVNEGLEVAMQQLDDKCTVEGFNLLEIMLVGRAVSAVVNELYPEGGLPDKGRATFVIATLEGDIHDLGKKIVKIVLLGKGYRVIDCGKDCPIETVVSTAQRENASAVLVSGLITSIIPQVRKVRPALLARGLSQVKIVAGGAALKQASTTELNVDFVAETAFDGVRYLEQIAQGVSQ